MPLKRIPTPTQDAGNWGTILNDHLAQTQNPLNGAFNSFDQFSARPNNLTADDAGRTYLYTQTGNWHEWSGTEWKVQNKSEINVKDYGAVGDGVADDTVAIQASLDLAKLVNGSIFIPHGTYLCNLKMPYYNASDIRGEGVNTTKLKSFKPNGYAIIILRTDTWAKFEFSHFTITGDAGLTRGGILFGDDIDTNYQEYAGGVSLHHVNFEDLNIGLYLPWGNIGNSFEHCSFYKCNYHFYNTAVLSQQGHDEMNVGFNTFYKCHFQLAQIASIYVNGRFVTANGGFVVRDCIFEQNPGFCFYVKDLGKAEIKHTFRLDNVWLEQNGTYVGGAPGNALQLVTIDGITYSPKDSFFKNVQITIQDTLLTPSILENASIFGANGTSINMSRDVIKDSQSVIVLSDVSSSYVSSPELFYTRSVTNGTGAAGSGGRFSAVFNTIPRKYLVNSNSYQVIFSETFQNIVTFPNVNLLGYNITANTGVLVNNGSTFNRCNQIQLTQGQNYILGNFNIPTNKYIVWSLDSNKVSGADYGMIIGASSDPNPTRLCTNPNNNLTQKLSFIGVVNTFGIPSFEASVFIFSGTGASVINLSALQIVAFDNLEEAIKFTDSGVFCLPVSTPRVFSDTGIPTTGAYKVGDKFYNTTPSAGGYEGWICTVAGTPGTWKGFGLIES